MALALFLLRGHERITSACQLFLIFSFSSCQYPYYQQPHHFGGAPPVSPTYIYGSPQPQPTVYVQQQHPTIIMQQPAPAVYHQQQPVLIVHEQREQKPLSDEETVVCASFFGMLGAILCVAASAESSKR